MVNGSLGKCGVIWGRWTSPHTASVAAIVCRAAVIALLLLAAVAAPPWPARPSRRPPTGGAEPPPTPLRPDQKAKRERDLAAILREEQRKAAETEAKLRSEIEAISEDRSKLNAALIETAARVRVAGNPDRRERRPHQTLDDNERAIRNSLAKRRGRHRRGPGSAAAHRPAPAAGPHGAARRCAAVGAHRHDAGRGPAGDAGRGRGADRRPHRAGARAQGDRRRGGSVLARPRVALRRIASA